MMEESDNILKPMQRMGAAVCMFKRNKGGAWEHGIAIMEDTGVMDVRTIVDNNGKTVPYNEMWEYRLHYWRGVITPISTKDGL
jgi:hypothetical protein